MLITETNLLQRRRATHESGHICAALSFGIPIISATIAGDRAFVLRNNYHAPTPAGVEFIDENGGAPACGYESVIKRRSSTAYLRFRRQTFALPDGRC